MFTVTVQVLQYKNVDGIKKTKQPRVQWQIQQARVRYDMNKLPPTAAQKRSSSSSEIAISVNNRTQKYKIKQDLLCYIISSHS